MSKELAPIVVEGIVDPPPWRAKDRANAYDSAKAQQAAYLNAQQSAFNPWRTGGYDPFGGAFKGLFG